MDKARFEAQLAADGYTEVAVKDRPPRDASAEHAHDYAVRALVLEGEITLTIAGDARRYGPGAVFAMAPGCRHAETIGDAGVRFVYGLRR